jgi:hypothetical protein
VVAKGPTHVERLTAQARDQVQSLPEAARPVIAVSVETLHSLDDKIAVLDSEIARRAEEDDDARRLKTIPGIGPVTAAAITCLPPTLTTPRLPPFRAERDQVSDSPPIPRGRLGDGRHDQLGNFQMALPGEN